MPELYKQEVVDEEPFGRRSARPVSSKEIMIPTDTFPAVEVAREEIGQLARSIKSLYESPSHVSFWMSVDVNTAKASLVPVPTYDNMAKMKDHYDSLPKRVRNTMKKNMSEQDFQSFQAIMEAFKDKGQKVLGEPEQYRDASERQPPNLGEDVRGAEDAEVQGEDR